MSLFNANIGKGRDEHHVGHELGERNDRGETH